MGKNCYILDISKYIKAVSMEIQIQELIDSIKKDGLEQAKKDAVAYLENAKAEADRIVADANDEAAKLIEKAKKEIALEEKSSKATLEQAARDAVLSFKKGVEQELDKIMNEEVSASVDGALLERLIDEVVSSDLVGKDAVIEVKDVKAVSEAFVKKLSDKVKKGLTIKSSNQVSGGFRVIEKDGSGYIDLTEREIAALLKPYLNESLKELI